MNQLDSSYANLSLGIVYSLVIFFVILTLKKQYVCDANGGTEELLSLETSKSLRGVAILLLILGHFTAKCVGGEQFFEHAGKWAVIIFLYISGVALSKTYGLVKVGRVFLIKRFRRLYFPFVISLIVFYSLDYFLLERSFSLLKMVLSFVGIVSTGPPNGPAWFITYIGLLYLLFYVISKLDSGAFFKVLVLILISYVVGYVVSSVDGLYSQFGIWTQYTVVFPASIAIGIKNKFFVKFLTIFYSRSRVLYVLVVLMFALQYFSAFGVNFIVNLSDSIVYQKITRSLDVISFMVLLVMLTFMLDRYRLKSNILSFLGEYSFEIYLMHMPFMVYYDFILFRRPLYIYFYIYLIFIFSIGILLRVISSVFDRKLWSALQWGCNEK